MIRVGIMLPRLGRYGGAEQFGYRLAGYLAGLPEKEFDVTFLLRSEERRVGKECRSRWSPYH